MSVVWIVHRDPNEQTALARLAGVADSATLGAPGDAAFREAPAPDAVVLGLAGDLEVELEFAHRAARTARGARWILVGDAERLARARRLFDVLPARYCLHPPQSRELRDALRATGDADAEPLALSQRPARDALAERFARAFADLDPPTLMRALDPRLADVPLLLLGEVGTGREVLARYVHHFGGTAGGIFVELPCSGATTRAELLERIAGARAAPGAARAATLWLAEPGRLAPALQQVVQGWIEYGLPPGHAPCRRLRWVASCSDDRLEPGLQRALSGLLVRIPPLRERPQLIANLVATTADNWCRARGIPTRRFGEHALAVLEEYPWPGNLRELEAVIEQSLAGSSANPIGPEDLLLEGEALAPIAAERATPPGATRPPTPTPTPTPPVSAPAPPAERPARTPAREVARSDDDVDALLEQLGSEDEELDVAAEFEPVPEPARAATADAPADAGLRQLAGVVGHELHGPLAAIRSFAELLPERHADAEFRSEFSRRVGENVARAERLVSRLERIAEQPAAKPEPVDVSALIEELLGKCREQIRARRLVVLEELDPARSAAMGAPETLRLALEALLEKAFALVPERGDVYLASRRLEAGLRSGPCVRVLLRLRAPLSREGDGSRASAPGSNAADFAFAELLARSQGGSLTLDATDRGETILLLDLPASGPD